MKRRPEREEPDNADRWVVSYADFITLLFAFFTVLYAISHVDKEKLSHFVGSSRQAFGTGGDRGEGVIAGIPGRPAGSLSLESDVRSSLDGANLGGGIEVRTDHRGVVVSVGDHVLFDPGMAVVKDSSRPALDAIGAIIAKTGREVIVEGHTDDLPIRSTEFPSNWELSAMRATKVLAYLVNKWSASPHRISAAGYAEFRPVASNATAEGRARNRRVDIVLLTGGREERRR